MNTNTIKTAVQIPSGFGMPMCGHRAQLTAVQSQPAIAAFGTTSVVRERAFAAKGDMGLAYVPGTSAWSPPLS